MNQTKKKFQWIQWTIDLFFWKLLPFYTIWCDTYFFLFTILTFTTKSFSIVFFDLVSIRSIPEPHFCFKRIKLFLFSVYNISDRSTIFLFGFSFLLFIYKKGFSLFHFFSFFLNLFFEKLFTFWFFVCFCFFGSRKKSVKR